MARILLCSAFACALAACAGAAPLASDPTAPLASDPTAPLASDPTAPLASDPTAPPNGCEAILALLDVPGPPPKGAELKSALGRRADSLAEVEVAPELVDDRQSYVAALRDLLARDPLPAIAKFSKHMAEVKSGCNADRCAELVQLFGAYAMHQPDLESSLGTLADELEAFDHADPKQQKALDDLARDARAASQGMRALSDSSTRVRLAMERVRERCAAGQSK